MRTKAPVFIDVEIRSLADLTVIHRLFLFHGQTINPDPLILPAFRSLRERLTGFGLDPDSLLHVGVPELAEGELVNYRIRRNVPAFRYGDVRRRCKAPKLLDYSAHAHYNLAHKFYSLSLERTP